MARRESTSVGLLGSRAYEQLLAMMRDRNLAPGTRLAERHTDIPTNWAKREDLSYRFERLLAQTCVRKEVRSWIVENWTESRTEPQFKSASTIPSVLEMTCSG
jgi:hypothetical protein